MQVQCFYNAWYDTGRRGLEPAGWLGRLSQHDSAAEITLTKPN